AIGMKRPISVRDLLTLRMGFGFTGELLSGDLPIWRAMVELMTTDHLVAEQKTGSPFSAGRGWGFGMGVVTKREEVSSTPGQYGWAGGYGTSWASDPREDLVAILMTQRLWDSPSRRTARCECRSRR